LPIVAQERLTKDQRREQAREIARLEREQRLKSQRRNSILIRVGATVAVVGVLAAVGWGIWAGTRPAGPGPANMASDGILFTGSADGTVTAVETKGVPADGEPTPTDPSDYDVPVHIVTYIDFGCPYCQLFETTNAEQIQELVASGYATLEVHPINLLSTSFQGDRYSARSANAGACVAQYQPDVFLAVSEAFYAQQPAETGPGLTNDEILTLLKGAGVTAPEVTSCVNDESFKGWVAAATDRALGGPLPNTDEEKVGGTPFILVNGVHYQGALDDTAAFGSFIAQNADFSSTGDGATPTPTPTPTP
jgi:protein-disulfide isomerase